MSFMHRFPSRTRWSASLAKSVVADNGVPSDDRAKLAYIIIWWKMYKISIQKLLPYTFN